MRISGRDVSRLYLAQHLSKGEGEGDTKKNKGLTDEVELSPEAKEVARASQAYEGLDIERSELVSSLRERIAGGEYRVSAREIAETMVRGGQFDRKA